MDEYSHATAAASVVAEQSHLLVRRRKCTVGERGHKDLNSKAARECGIHGTEWGSVHVPESMRAYLEEFSVGMQSCRGGISLVSNSGRFMRVSGVAMGESLTINSSGSALASNCVAKTIRAWGVVSVEHCVALSHWVVGRDARITISAPAQVVVLKGLPNTLHVRNDTLLLQDERGAGLLPINAEIIRRAGLDFADESRLDTRNKDAVKCAKSLTGMAPVDALDFALSLYPNPPGAAG